MARWLTYAKERFPIVVYLLLVGGFVFSGRVYSGVLNLPSLTMAFIILLVFFFELRLMDELKDYEKDLVAHPERPLPRGLLKPGEVQKAIVRIWGIGFILFSSASFFFGGPDATILFVTFWGWLWLMYKEFYVGKALQGYPMIYAISHQIILFPIAAYVVTICDAEKLWAPGTWYYGMVGLGAFFSYEVARKLDPKAHPLLKTYLQIYGQPGTFLITLCSTALAFAGGLLAGEWQWLAPIQILFLLTSLLVWFKPEKYKIAEAMASVFLLTHLWAGGLALLFLR